MSDLTIADYEEVLADKRRLTRELDVLLNGPGAAEQASLCDLVSQVASGTLPMQIRLIEARGIVAALCMTAKRKSYTPGFWETVDKFLNPGSVPNPEAAPK